MSTFAEHVSQANRNLIFLQTINRDVSDCWDWQVTSAFYAAVHFVNAHIVSQIGQHYRSHEDVDKCLNPYGGDIKCRFTEPVYKNYKKLQTLSRRSRYLCSDNFKEDDGRNRLTYDIHLAKAVTNLDAIIIHLNGLYPGNLLREKINIHCEELTRTPLQYFAVIKKT